MREIPEFSALEFEKLLIDGKQLIIADFFTNSCGPCRRVVPMLEEVGREFSSALIIVRVDIEKEPRLAARFDVVAVPTLLVFVNGSIFGRIVGVVPKKDLLRMIRLSSGMPS